MENSDLFSIFLTNCEISKDSLSSFEFPNLANVCFIKFQNSKDFILVKGQQKIAINTMIVYPNPVLMREVYIDFPFLFDCKIYRIFQNLKMTLPENKISYYSNPVLREILVSLKQQYNLQYMEKKDFYSFKINEDNKLCLSALHFADQLGFIKLTVGNPPPDKIFLVYNIPPSLSKEDIQNKYNVATKQGGKIDFTNDLYLGYIAVLSEVDEADVIKFVNELEGVDNCNLKIEYFTEDEQSNIINSDISHMIAKARLEHKKPDNNNWISIKWRLPVNMSFLSIASLLSPLPIERISCAMTLNINQFYREYIIYIDNEKSLQKCRDILTRLYPKGNNETNS